MLKAIVDETSHGKYDFMYLRIGEDTQLFFNTLWMILTISRLDFANNCKYAGTLHVAFDSLLTALF
jgi:hypothetical protein